MKKLFILFIISCLWSVFIACEDEKVGFLVTENASYEPDSLVITKTFKNPDVEFFVEPNPEYYQYLEWGYTPEQILSFGIYPEIRTPNMDYYRLKFNSPWVSLGLQGYEGTEQILFSVESVTSPDVDDGGVEYFRQQVGVRGGGVLEFPLKSEAKPGRYVISVRLSNESYSQVVEDCFTFIVKE